MITLREEIAQALANDSAGIIPKWEHLSAYQQKVMMGLGDSIIALIFTKAQTMPMTAAAQSAGCLQYIKALLYGRE
jgi:hypothetical protein